MMKKSSSSCSPEEQETDRISDMPEPIQSHIVSFLPLEDATRTSVLSKQWRNICKTLSNFNFDINYYKQKRLHNNTRGFEDAVNQILNFHDESNIHKFSLLTHSRESSHVTHIHEWISFAVHHNVEQLELRFFPLSSKLKRLPDCLFTCQSLRVLRLVGTNLKFPTHTEFPKLKTLSLSQVKLYGKDPVDQLISSCLVLEFFSLYGCFWDSHQAVLNISAPTLKSLYLNIWYPIKDYIATKISASNLHKIIYFGHPPDISSQTLSSLKDASFTLQKIYNASDAMMDVLSHNARKICTGLRNASKLCLKDCYTMYLIRFEGVSACHLTSCCSLQDLKLDMYRSRDNVPAIVFLLENYPNLRTLSISFEETYMENNLEEYWPSQGLSTDGVLKHLKTVAISLLEGSESELDLVKYLLGNANALEEMNIEYVRLNAVKQRTVHHKCSMFIKVSPSTVISFSP